MSVDSEPTTAAPTPAIWPRGFIANALRLPNKIPKPKNVNKKYKVSDHNGGCPLLIDVTPKKNNRQGYDAFQ